MILVTGATGNVGREILKLLAERRVPAGAMVRDVARAELPPGIVPVAGEFDDSAALAGALIGVDRAFLLTPSSEEAEARQTRFVAAAAGAGVGHVVKLSQYGASAASPVRFLRYHAAVETALQASGLDWSILRPNLFMQGLLLFAEGIRTGGTFAAPIGAAKVSVVDVRDIAAAAVAALTGDTHAGRTYTLTGPDAPSHAEMAAALSGATGRPIRFATISADEMRAALAAAGMAAWQADGLVGEYPHYCRGEAAEIAPGVEEATGRPPRGFADFARDYAGAFTPAP